jgi:hypothetical protein
MKDVVTQFLRTVAIVTIIPLWCLLAWNGFASAFHLPFFSYWHWVVTALAIRGIFTRPIVKGE